MITIITPVYNVERYLRFTLDSVIAQTYFDWELLLIDDGSTDESGKICDSYAQKDHRIRVFHLSNGGVSKARNIGLSEAKGEFVTFLDSDDMWTTDFLQSVYSHMINEHLDLCSVWREFVDEKCQYTSVHNTDVPCCVYNNHENKSLFTDCPDFFTVVWGKLFKMDLIQRYKLRFEDSINRGEDSLFLACYFSSCNSVGLSYAESYQYRIREKSLMRSENDNLFEMDIVRFLSYNRFIEYHSNAKEIESVFITQFLQLMIINLLKSSSFLIMKRRLIIISKNVVVKKALYKFNSHFMRKVRLSVGIINWFPCYISAVLLLTLNKYNHEHIVLL